MIPPKQSSEFVARMEVVLDVYKRPYNRNNPVICMDETPKQLIGETKVPIPQGPGYPAKHDYEYKRNGVCNIFMASELLCGKRYTKVTEYKKKGDWAEFIESIADKAHSVLGWQAHRNLHQMCIDAWNYEKRIKIKGSNNV